MYGTSNNTVPIRRPKVARLNQTTHHRPRTTRKDRVRAAAQLPQGV
jgi:hypothetical protein